jgi:hypothetical protein
VCAPSTVRNVLHSRSERRDASAVSWLLPPLYRTKCLAPMQVKEALFSILVEFNVMRDDAIALDTFSGCGSVGIEALSRGLHPPLFSLARKHILLLPRLRSAHNSLTKE